MMKKMMIAVTLCSLALAGCATPKILSTVNGSKADGTIDMGYSYYMFEKPIVNINQAKADAARKCQVWG